jgi:hypothetical protein
MVLVCRNLFQISDELSDSLLRNKGEKFWVQKQINCIVSVLYVLSPEKWGVLLCGNVWEAESNLDHVLLLFPENIRVNK